MLLWPLRYVGSLPALLATRRTRPSLLRLCYYGRFDDESLGGGLRGENAHNFNHVDLFWSQCDLRSSDMAVR